MKRLLMRASLVGVTVLVTGCAPASDTIQNEDDVEEVSSAAPTYTPPTVTAESHDLTLADVERLMEELSNWGRWGSDDQLGAANLITPAKRLEAIALATEGITVSLAHPMLTDEAPDVANPLERSIIRLPDPTAAPPFRGGVSDIYNIHYHGYSHSHIDALCHMMYKGLIYNGVSQDTITEEGCTNASVANLQDGIVTRGVLIDIPRLKGVPYLEPGTPIYMEDLDAWEEMTGVTVRPGDAVFIRTGRWARRADVGPWDISESMAGLHVSATPWLKARDISFLGGDGASDVTPAGVEGVTLPVHLLTIVAMGVDLFDNQDLEALAETAAELNRWEFMFVAAPLPVATGTGSPINALAIF